jgi:hypothetical protein
VPYLHVVDRRDKLLLVAVVWGETEDLGASEHPVVHPSEWGDRFRLRLAAPVERR